jgi:uncharacterized protein YecT (DUF1311 family)
MSFSIGHAIPSGLRGFVILLFIGHIGVVLAQKGIVRQKQCGDYGTQSEMNDCAAREAHEADEALNATYKKLLVSLRDDKTATARVVVAEKAWVTLSHNHHLHIRWCCIDRLRPPRFSATTVQVSDNPVFQSSEEPS